MERNPNTPQYPAGWPPPGAWPPPYYPGPPGWVMVPAPAASPSAEQAPAAGQQLAAAPSAEQAAMVPPGAPPRPQVPPAARLARWDTRAYAALVDVSIGAGILTAYQMTLVLVGPLMHVVVWVTGLLGGDFTAAVRWGMWALLVGWWGWQWVQRGQTGQTLGQRLMGVAVVDQETRQPIGAARSVARSLTHVVDIVPLWAGFVRPVWSPDGQTWADRIHRTVAIETARPGR